MKGKRLVFGCISNTLKVKISSVFQIYQISFFLLCHFSELVKYCLAEFFRQGTPAPWQNFFARKIWGNWGIPPPFAENVVGGKHLMDWGVSSPLY